MTTGVMLMFPGASIKQVLYAVQLPTYLAGNFGLLFAAAFSHKGDVCHATGGDVTRTMGTHHAYVQIGIVLGAVTGPQLYKHLGFFGVFPLVLLLQLSSLVYVLYFMKDVNINTNNEVSVLNWKLPLNAIQCLVRRREGKKRMIIILMLIVAMGDRKIMSGSLLILSLLKRRLKMSDEAVGMLSCFSYVLETTGLIISASTHGVFWATIGGIIGQGSQVVQQPILNRQVLSTEQARKLGRKAITDEELQERNYSWLLCKEFMNIGKITVMNLL